jgi:hypothetical protein
MATNLQQSRTPWWKRTWIRYGVAGTLLTAALIAAGLHFELKTADWAAWVQAVGSVVAITVGFILADRQSKAAALQSRRERLAADDEQARCVLEVARLVQAHLEPALEEMRVRGDVFGYLQVTAGYVDFDGAKRAIDSVPLFQLRSSEAIHGVLLLSASVNQVRHMTKLGQDDPMFIDLDFDEFKSAAEQTLGDLKTGIDHIVDLADQCHRVLLDHDDRSGNIL